jgi:hypothetical protein
MRTTLALPITPMRPWSLTDVWKKYRVIHIIRPVTWYHTCNTEWGADLIRSISYQMVGQCQDGLYTTGAKSSTPQTIPIIDTEERPMARRSCRPTSDCVGSCRTSGNIRSVIPVRHFTICIRLSETQNGHAHSFRVCHSVRLAGYPCCG